MKKFLSVILSILLLLSIATPVMASEYSPEEIDAALLARGIPSDVIAAMDDSEKEMVYSNPNLIFLDTFSINYSEPTVGSNAEAQPYGQISVSDLSLTFRIYSTLTTSNTLDFLLVTFNYRWNNLPVFRFQDCIAISWDGSKFRLKDDSFMKYDRYSAAIYDGTGNYTYVSNQVFSQESGYASSSTDGVSWYADLKGDIGMTVTELYGSGSFTLLPAHGVTVYSGEQATLYARYVHPTISLGASIGVPDYGSFNVSCGGTYDERGTQSTFTIKEDIG